MLSAVISIKFVGIICTPKFLENGITFKEITHFLQNYLDIILIDVINNSKMKKEANSFKIYNSNYSV